MGWYNVHAHAHAQLSSPVSSFVELVVELADIEREANVGELSTAVISTGQLQVGIKG